jgi:hypothetical protein
MALQTRVVCPVFESITVFTGRQLQVTVLAFSCLVTTQCSMTSAVGGGSWLRMGGGVAATGCFFAAQPARSRQNTSPAFFMLSVFALPRSLVDGNLGYTLDAHRTSSHTIIKKDGNTQQGSETTLSLPRGCPKGQVTPWNIQPARRLASSAPASISAGRTVWTATGNLQWLASHSHAIERNTRPRGSRLPRKPTGYC